MGSVNQVGLPDRCPACSEPWSSSDAGALSGLTGWDVHRCARCGAGVTVPWDRAIAIDRGGGSLYPAAERVRMYESRRRELSTRFRQVLREVEAHTPVNSLLDVGCSTGFYLDLARDLGVGSVEGVELDEGCRSWGRENLGLEIARSIGDVKGREFDVVLMLDVLEHVADPLQILREVLHLLKPGGFAFCQSPNIDSEMARRSGSRWSWLIPPDHVIHFTPMSLERLLEAAGFTVEESYTGDFVADYVGDVYPLIPGRLLIRLASIDRFAILRRRAGSQGGIIRLIARRTA